MELLNCSQIQEGFLCSCNDGYTLDLDGVTCNSKYIHYRFHQVNIMMFFKCIDINECEATPSGPCDDNADCTDTPGSFGCTCRLGYTGDGFSCQGKYMYLFMVF